MNKKTSLKDIAKQVGVSTTLVSYVLNNQKEGRINKEVAQKIREVAKELNYRANQIAKSLKTNKTFTIGLIVADIANPFFSSLARIIEDEADKENYTVIFGSSDENSHKFSKLMNALMDRQVDGFILAPPEGCEPELRMLQEQEIPFILIDRYFPGFNTSYVALDNYKSAYAAVNHLIQEGHSQRIGLITYQTSLFHLLERKRGYISALKENNLPLKKTWIKELPGGNLKSDVEKALHQLLFPEHAVDSLFFVSNRLAFYGLKYINSLNIKVPDDLAIVSFDETEASDLFYAPLTYLKQPIQEMGAMATNILLESIGKNNKIIQVNMEGELVIRKST